jgi:hypothetical protein
MSAVVGSKEQTTCGRSRLEVCGDWVGTNVALIDVGKVQFLLPAAKEMDLMNARLI